MALAPGGGSPVAPDAAQAAADCTLRDVMPTSGVHAGMTGTGYTVIDGRTVHPFEVDILGVLPDGIAPGLDSIMVSVPKGLPPATPARRCTSTASWSAPCPTDCPATTARSVV